MTMKQPYNHFHEKTSRLVTNYVASIPFDQEVKRDDRRAFDRKLHLHAPHSLCHCP